MLKSVEKLGTMLADSITLPQSKPTKSKTHLQGGITPVVSQQTS